MMELHTITRVKLWNPEKFSLLLSFDQGEEAVVDLSSIFAQGGVFEPLRDPKRFAAVEIGELGRTLFWREGDDDVDLCADALWRMAHPDRTAEL